MPSPCTLLHGDYFRHVPKTEGKKRKWFCPALDQKAKVQGTPNAYNASAWVETDAVNSMLYYLSSGDFFRMCNDQSRELELNTAGMSDAAAREELHRASNVLTSYYDIQVDGTLRDAIRAHLNDHDHRWLMGHPTTPATPPPKRTRSYSACCGGGGDKENTGLSTCTEKLKIAPQRQEQQEQQQAKGSTVLRRANSSVLPRGVAQVTRHL